MRSELSDHAERLESTGQWAEASELWASLAEGSGDPQTLVRYARALARAGRTDDAERILKQTLATAPEMSVVHFSLGLLFEDQGRLREAREALECGLKLEEHQPHLTILGDVQWRLGDLAAAEQTFTRSLELDSNDDEAHYGMGLVLKDTRPLEAVDHIRRAIEVDPALHRAHRELGYTLWRTGQLPEAVDALRTAISLDPDDAWAHDYLGHIYGKQGNWPAARDEFCLATEAQPRIGYFWCNLADAYVQLGDRVQADRHFQSALATGMGFPVIDRRYGLFLTVARDALAELNP